jgi:hypothetical protein
MGNLNNTALLITHQINKGDVNERSLIGILEQDCDFSQNEEYYREDTLGLGFNNEAERVSKEIFDKHKNLLDKDKEDFDEYGAIQLMVNELFDISNFIGQSSSYGDYSFEIIETDFEYIVVIATII